MVKKFKILSLILFLFNFGEISQIAAQSTCSTITYYSKKDWIKHEGLIDTAWQSGDSMVLNSQDIVVKSNTFGTHSNPYMASSDAYNGLIYYSAKGSNGTSSDQNYFSILLGRTIKLDDFEFEIDAYNEKTGEKLNKKVYINSEVDWVDGQSQITKGELIYETTDPNRVTVDAKNREINSIHIWFENWSPDNIYILKYFQINSYELYEHVEWVLDFIPNTEIKDIQVCSGSGKYDPDGNGNWEKKSSTIFSPSIDIVSDYVPVVNNQQVSYDFCRGSYISAYTQPNCIKGMDTNSQSIRGWTELGGRPWNTWYSFGNGGVEFPYIQSTANNTTGVQYESTPVYWSQSKEANWINGVNSYDSGWCNHTTGSSRTPCYKHYGHSTNSRLNSYDVNVKTYKNVVDPSKRYISKAEYYLVNEDTKLETHLLTAKDEIQMFNFNETGRWRIKAVITDLVGLTGSKTSNIFYIDNKAPEVLFSPYESLIPTKENINTLITPSDEHSGVKHWRYSLSNDEGKTWSSYSAWITNTSPYNITFSTSGKHKIKINLIDNTGNENTLESGVYIIERGDISIGSMYSKVYTPGEIERINAKISCKDCSKDTPAVVKVWMNGNLIHEEEIQVSNEYAFYANYIATGDYANVKLEITSLSDEDKLNNSLELIIPKKSMEYKETTGHLVEFEGTIVCSIETDQPQKNSKEKLALNLRNDFEFYFAGQGIPAKIQVSYFNECNSISNWKCIPGKTYEDGNVNAKFIHGAEPVREKYLKGNKYEVSMSYEENGSYYLLPEMFATKYEGQIYDDVNDAPIGKEVINAGRKWYTDIRGTEGLYTFEIKGELTAVNLFSWKFEENYEIKETVNQQYRIRFADPTLPFPNQESIIWEDYIEWFDSLDQDKPLYTFEIKGDK